jgi:hypothetical protein
MFAQLLTAIKDLTGARFYFLTTLIFVAFLAMTFKDQIKQFDFNPKELRKCSNEKGLLQKLIDIRQQHRLTTGYALFLYQPKEESYYKKLVSTDNAYLKSNEYFQAIPLNTQKYLNYLMIEREYVLLSTDDTNCKDYITEYGSDYVLVYNIYVKETIGEVIFTFDVKPTQDEINALVKDLRNVKYYVI